MSLDWQTITVILIVTGALAYLGRRGWARWRSFRGGVSVEGGPSSCATGCGGCGTEKPAASLTPPRMLVQIKSASNSSRQQAR